MEEIFSNYETKELFERIKQIEDYRKNNTGCDPNAYEMVEILSKFKGVTSHYNINQSEWNSDEFKYIHNVVSNFLQSRMSQFVEPNFGLKNTNGNALYNYFNNTFFANSSIPYNLDNPDVKNICAKACGVNLYVHQQLRDNLNTNTNNVLYDNFNELQEFENNIKNSNLSSETLEVIEDLRNENKIAYNKTPNQFVQAINDYYLSKKTYLSAKEKYENSKYDFSLTKEEKGLIERNYNNERIIYQEILSCNTEDYQNKEKEQKSIDTKFL